MRGNKMTFPFSGEFKFNHLKAKREDDVTSSTINNLNGDLHLNSFKKKFLLLFYIFIPRENAPKKFLHARESGGK